MKSQNYLNNNNVKVAFKNYNSIKTIDTLEKLVEVLKLHAINLFQK